MTLTTINRNENGHFDGSPFTSVITNSCLITLHYSRMEVVETFVNLTKYEIEIYKTPSVLLSALTEVFIHDVRRDFRKTGNETDFFNSKYFDKSSRRDSVGTKQL